MVELLVIDFYSCFLGRDCNEISNTFKPKEV